MIELCFYAALAAATFCITNGVGGHRSFKDGFILIPIVLLVLIGAGAAMETDFISDKRYFDFEQFVLAMLFGLIGIAGSCACTALPRATVDPGFRTDITRPADRIPTPRVDIHV